MTRASLLPWLPTMTVAAIVSLAPSAAVAGRYTVAFWREAGAYENQAPPAGEFGNHSAFVHVWDENGQPLAGKQIYTSWGVLLGATDANGFVEIVLNRPNGYDFQVRDGAHLTDTTPVLSVERAPNWGHYSFEVGFLFKQNAANPGLFDTGWFGTVNASGADPCLNLSAPHTRSLAFCSTDASNYCSDAYALGNWTASHGQTFVATGNRVVALKAMMAAGLGVHYYWTAQILEGGPSGTPIGPARSTRLFVDGEYYPILVKWGVNDVQVVPGRTYYFQITRGEGVNVFRVNRDNYAGGNYYENGVSVPGAELMGLVVCGTFTNAGPTGTLSGSVRDTNGIAIGGTTVTVADAALYTTTAEDGSYTLPFVPAGTYDVTASKPGFTARVNAGVTISAGLVATSTFSLTLQSTNPGTGIITNAGSILQPFETDPAWTSTFDAVWGNAASFTIVSGGQTGNALQAVRSGPGSSARVQTFPVKTNTPYQLSVWIRCPSSTAAYWAECAYRLGQYSAEDFDGNAGAWTLIRKFSNTGVNGNGNVWTLYTANFNSAANTQVSIGFKLGASSGTGPTVHWDQLALVSLTLPGIALAVADSPTNLTVQFAEPVSETTATNLANYRLTHAGASIALLGANLVDATNVLLVTELQPARADLTLVVSNLTAVLQPPSLTGRNGQVAIRVPLPLLAVDDASAWKYNESGLNPGTTWRTGAYDDSAWPSGAAVFGTAGGPLPEPIRTALTPATGKLAFYFRTRFTLPLTASNALLRLRPVVDDGAVFWLNGTELFRLGITNNPVTYLTRAARTVGLAAYEGPFDLASASLLRGTNLFAVEVHQVDPTSPDVVFGTALEALVLPSQVPITNAVLTIVRQAEAVALTWTESAMTLESATNLLGPWASYPGTSPVTVLTTNATRFFRLRQ